MAETMSSREFFNDLKEYSEHDRQVYMASLSEGEAKAVLMLTLRFLDESCTQPAPTGSNPFGSYDTPSSSPRVKLEHLLNLEHLDDDAHDEAIDVGPQLARKIRNAAAPPPSVKIVSKQQGTSLMELPIMLAVPKANGLFEYHDIRKSVFSIIGGTLAHRFKAMCKTILEEPAKHLSGPDMHFRTSGCVRNMIVGATKTHGSVTLCADESCVKSGYPCGHLAVHGGQVVVVIVPLPASKRFGQQSTQLGYWIRGEKKARKSQAAARPAHTMQHQKIRDYLSQVGH